MTFLCRFHQRNRLIEIPVGSEFYHQQNGVSHENLKQLIGEKKNSSIHRHVFLLSSVQEFQLQNYAKNTLIVQIWNEQYQEYIDIESFKRLPFEGRLQVLM